MSRRFTVLLAVCVCLSLIPCVGFGEPASEYYKKFDPPVPLTQGMVVVDDVWPAELYPDGVNMSDNIFTQWAEDTVGIQWSAKWIAPDEDTSQQKLNLAMASNNLPDLMYVDSATMAKLAKAGQIQPLDELMESYLSPLTKYLLQEMDQEHDGMYLTPMMMDGQVYGIPNYMDNVASPFIWYRKDLLDALGAEVPDSIDQLEGLFSQFKAAYPDKICLTLTNDGYSDAIYDAFEAYPEYWLMKDGQLVYGGIQPENKAALELLASWYQKGYLDPEFVVTSERKWVGGKVLMESGAWWYSWGDNLNLLANEPDAVLDVGPALTNADGERHIKSQPHAGNGSGFVISSKCKNPEAILIQYNFFLDSAFRNHEDLYTKFDFYYAPDPEQTCINPEEVEPMRAKYTNSYAVLAFEKYNYAQPGPGTGAGSGFFNNYFYYPNQYGIRIQQRSCQLLNTYLRMGEHYLAGTLEAMDNEAAVEYNKMAFWGDNLLRCHFKGLEMYGTAIGSLQENGVRDQFLGAPTDTMIQKKAYLDKIQEETYAKIIMGELPISAFDEFVTNWLQNGGEAITQEVNAWYASVN